MIEPAKRGVPEFLSAILEAFRFRSPSDERLRRLTDIEWNALLDWCDAKQLTFLLLFICRDSIPESVTYRLAACHSKYLERFNRLKQELAEIVRVLKSAGLNFVLLKGLTHSPQFTPDPLMRIQGDIDLWLKPDSIYQARDVLANIGYVALKDSKCRHLPPMTRRSHWKWRGDRFDPNMPIAVELHYELWSAEAEYIAFPDLDEFWNRVKTRTFDDFTAQVLCEEDLLAFAALHLLLHLIHGELPLQRAWEIANFLHREAGNEGFWSRWRQLHSGALRQAEVLVFELVHRWFGCELGQVVEQEISNLPDRVSLWLDHFSLSPLTAQIQPNKDDLWLHLALINSRRGRFRVLTRRLAPVCVPGFADRATDGSPLFRMFRQRRLLFSRAVYHVTTALPTIYQGLRWIWLFKEKAGQ